MKKAPYGGSIEYATDFCLSSARCHFTEKSKAFRYPNSNITIASLYRNQLYTLLPKSNLARDKQLSRLL